MPSESERLAGDAAMVARQYDSSPSRYATGQKCARKRYYAHEFDGVGLERVGDFAADAAFGSAIHWELQRQMVGQPADAANSALAELLHETRAVLTPDGHSASVEWLALFNGLSRTFAASMKPRLDSAFEWIASELDVVTTFGDLRWRTILDGVVRRKDDDMFFVVEAKTTSWASKLLAESQTNFQLLVECEVMRRKLGLRPEQVGGAMLLVFDKGYKAKVEKDGEVIGYRRMSPFTYWWRQDSADGMSDYLLSRPRKWAGWELTPTWTVPGWYEFAVEKWADEIAGTVQLWPSVSFDPDRVESVLRQVEAVEERFKRAASVDEVGLDRFWPQTFSNCSNDGGFGKECPFKLACFSPTIHRDPIGSGEYRLRERK